MLMCFFCFRITAIGMHTCKLKVYKIHRIACKKQITKIFLLSLSKKFRKRDRKEYTYTGQIHTVVLHNLINLLGYSLYLQPQVGVLKQIIRFRLLTYFDKEFKHLPKQSSHKRGRRYTRTIFLYLCKKTLAMILPW